MYMVLFLYLLNLLQVAAMNFQQPTLISTETVGPSVGAITGSKTKLCLKSSADSYDCAVFPIFRLY